MQLYVPAYPEGIFFVLILAYHLLPIHQLVLQICYFPYHMRIPLGLSVVLFRLVSAQIFYLLPELISAYICIVNIQQEDPYLVVVISSCRNILYISNCVVDRQLVRLTK